MPNPTAEAQTPVEIGKTNILDQRRRIESQRRSVFAIHPARFCFWRGEWWMATVHNEAPVRLSSSRLPASANLFGAF